MLTRRSTLLPPKLEPLSRQRLQQRPAVLGLRAMVERKSGAARKAMAKRMVAMMPRRIDEKRDNIFMPAP
jgi:hypothetical protein